MKSFLHRVATGVVQPRASLHPLVQPIYAPSANRNGSEFEAPQESMQTIVSEQRRVPTHPESRDGLVQPIVSRQAPQEEGFQPLVPPLQEDRSLSNRGREAYARVDERYAPGPASKVARTNNTHDTSLVEASEEGSSQLAGFMPVVTQSNASEAGQPANQLTQEIIQSSAYADFAKAEIAHANARRQLPQPAPESHIVSSQSDNIQIHIGRIEVIAVPQSAPRPVAPALRKGLSLDEYLGRANGRSR